MWPWAWSVTTPEHGHKRDVSGIHSIQWKLRWGELGAELSFLSCPGSVLRSGHSRSRPIAQNNTNPHFPRVGLSLSMSIQWKIWILRALYAAAGGQVRGSSKQSDSYSSVVVVVVVLIFYFPVLLGSPAVAILSIFFLVPKLPVRSGWSWHDAKYPVWLINFSELAELLT